MMPLMESLILGIFALLFVIGFTGQLMLIKFTDWSSLPVRFSKLGYLAWGFYSVRLINAHVPLQYRQGILVVRRMFLFSLVLAIMLVVGNFIAQVA